MKNLDFIQMAFRRNSCVFFTQLIQIKNCNIQLASEHYDALTEILIKPEGIKRTRYVRCLQFSVQRKPVKVTGSTKRYYIIHINKLSCFLTMFSSKITTSNFS